MSLEKEKKDLVKMDDDINDKKPYQLSRELFSLVKTYIDDHFIKADEEISPNRACIDPDDSMRNSLMESSDFLIKEPIEAMSFMAETSKAKKRKLEDIINQVDESFSEMLLRLIDDKGLKDPLVYKAANVTKQTFSKIRNNTDYSPKKNTAIAFAIALKLSMDETKDLLQKAGFVLTHSSKSDLIISYFIEEAIYDIQLINTTLFEFGFSPLGL